MWHSKSYFSRTALGAYCGDQCRSFLLVFSGCSTLLKGAQPHLTTSLEYASRIVSTVDLCPCGGVTFHLVQPSLFVCTTVRTHPHPPSLSHSVSPEEIQRSNVSLSAVQTSTAAPLPQPEICRDSYVTSCLQKH